MARILIAEDNDVTAEMMDVRLRGAGHEVLRAANGREALERLHDARCDLILLDMMMPEVDGAQFLKRAKEDALLGSIPVLVVSARAREEDILSALAGGATDYVTKPFSLRELVARVDRVLSQGPEPLRMAVQPEEGEIAVGEVVRADGRGTSIRFPSHGAPALGVGSHAKLSMSSPWLSESIELRGEVTSRAEAEPIRTYGFRFLDQGESAREMKQALLDVIGRRGAYRVALDPEQAIDALVLTQAHGESRELQARLVDLSTGGARIVIKGEADRYLHRVDGFELRFSLPGADAPLTLDVAIRHRVRCEEGVAYGLRFEGEHSPDFLDQQEEISAFVLARVK